MPLHVATPAPGTLRVLDLLADILPVAAGANANAAHAKTSASSIGAAARRLWSKNGV